MICHVLYAATLWYGHLSESNCHVPENRWRYEDFTIFKHSFGRRGYCLFKLKHTFTNGWNIFRLMLVSLQRMNRYIKAMFNLPPSPLIASRVSIQSNGYIFINKMTM